MKKWSQSRKTAKLVTFESHFQKAELKQGKQQKQARVIEISSIHPRADLNKIDRRYSFDDNGGGYMGL